MHSEIYTGEIKGSPLTSLTTLLTEIFVPVIKVILIREMIKKRILKFANMTY